MQKTGFCIRMEEEWVLEESKERLACGLWQHNHLSNPIFSNTHFHFFSWQTKHHSPSLLGLPFTRLWSAWARTMEAFTATRPLVASWFASLTNSTTPKSFAPETLRFGSSLIPLVFSFFFFFAWLLRKYDVFCMVDGEMWYFWGFGLWKTFCFGLVFGNMTFIFFWLIRNFVFLGGVVISLMVCMFSCWENVDNGVAFWVAGILVCWGSFLYINLIVSEEWMGVAVEILLGCCVKVLYCCWCWFFDVSLCV